MHRTLRPFELLEPQTIEEAVQNLTSNRAKVLAGGLDLISRMRRWQMKPECLVSIQRIPGLDTIEGNGTDGLRIGALTTIRDLELSSTIQKHYVPLYEAVHQIASVQVKTMGTVVGNICVATPASDIAPVLSVCGAELKIVGSDGEKTVPIDTFYRGLEETILRADQIVTEICIPPVPVGSGGAFLKLAHTAACIAKVNAAVMVTVTDGICKEARIALGAVAPTVIRASRGEEVLKGKAIDDRAIQRAAEASVKESTPITDLRSNAEYRKEMVGVLVKRGIEKALQRAKAEQ